MCRFSCQFALVVTLSVLVMHRAELEAEYAERTERQRRREADAMERLKEREKTMDADAHAHRQKMLADLERLREVLFGATPAMNR
eukprot:SAG31_NODE_504_length_14762_cov_3.344609_9_plen_85_part_00